MQKGKIIKYKKIQSIPLENRNWPNVILDKAPIWTSVDLRDGNQALAKPMDIHEKLEFFDYLVQIGFKEIEVGFPSANDTEFNFIRKLITEKRIPKDVTIQVLVQAREHLIEKTFKSLEGANSAIIHLYNSTSPTQRKITFNKSKKEIKDIAVQGTKLVKSFKEKNEHTKFRYEYSPESFSDTEPEFALEVCQAVMDVWEPSEKEPIILNLPATVEVSTPNIYADQIEWFCKNLKKRKTALISLHTHNDRGTGVAATELGLLAGADRVEGTLFGNGERTGNLDIVNLALNLYAQGVDPLLKLDNLESIKEMYQKVTNMKVPERHPYSGNLVFTAFSGSHQDAIKKGLDFRDKKESSEDIWNIPYLLIDPKDIGRDYEAIIRINSQSGKGGIAYILNNDYGLDLPKSMHPEVGRIMNEIADKKSRELKPEEVYQYFKNAYIDLLTPLELIKFNYNAIDDSNSISIQAQIKMKNNCYLIKGIGNGPISAFVDALDNQNLKNFKLSDYRQHSIGLGSKTQSASYIQITCANNLKFYGCGIDNSIDKASLKSLVSAINRSYL